jgi:hypothetical protein
VAKKADVKRIKAVSDLMGEKVIVKVTDGNRVTEETTFTCVVQDVMDYGVLVNFPQRGALITLVIPWVSIVVLKHRAKGVKSADEVTAPASAPKRRGRKPQAAAEPEPEAQEPEEPEATVQEPEAAPVPEPEPAPESEPDPEPDPEPEPDEDEGSAVGAEDDEDEVYTGGGEDDEDEEFYAADEDADEDFGADDDED